MVKKKWIGCIIVLFLIVLPIGFSLIQPKEITKKDEVIECVKHRRFKDIDVVSSKKPKNTHLFIETNNSGILYLVDSVDETKIYKSTDKGKNWVLIETRTENIQACWHDRDNGFFYFLESVTYDDAPNEVDSFYIDLSDDSVNELGILPIDNGFGGNDDGWGMDIFILSGDVYAVTSYNHADAQSRIAFYKYAAGWGEIDELTLVQEAGFGDVASGNYWIIDYEDNLLDMVKFTGAVATKEANLAGYGSPIRNLFGMAYDGNDLLFFIAKKVADGKNYLISYSITGDTYTVLEEHNVSLMLNRNNIGIAPNEFEKGFSIDSTEKVYEIKARRGGIRLLQDLSALTDAVIIAITDNFLMNDDGDMFEFVDVTSEISTIRYNAGTIGIEKKGTFTADPRFNANWNKKDSIKIYDNNDVLEFHGIITDKNRNSRGIYVFKIDSFTNEMFRNTYEKAYSGDDTDTKQKDIIDNACDFNYRDSSIVGTTTTYDYAYNRAIVYLFWLARFLERQVPYIEPDGKIWTAAHDGLAKNPLIYPGTYSFKDDENGANPAGWVVDEGGGTINIIAELDGHRNVMELDDTDGGDDIRAVQTFSAGAQIFGTVEFWIRLTDVTDSSFIRILSGGTARVNMRINGGKIQYSHSGGNHDATGGGVAVDTLYHFKFVFDCSPDTYIFYLNGVELDADIPFDNDGADVDNIYFRTSNAPTYTMYVDAVGYSWDPAYTVGDNEVAWNIANHWQEIFLIDVPDLDEMMQGFFDGNTGVTRNTVRYRDNAFTIRPVAATRDPIEQLQGILSLNEFRDPKIEASTEADQLGDNRYAIWSKDTIFLGLRIQGQGYLQPGKTVNIINTGQITIPENDYLVLMFERDPKNDVYNSMILSDNIIFPSEFEDLQDTLITQVHTASVQAIENQFDINLHLTREGGIAVKLTNETGAASIKGTLVEADGAVDNAFDVADADSVECFGAVYEDGIADGEECLVVIGGRCQVLLKDATLSTRHNWVKVSDVAGRADATGASPAAAPTHFKEIGHCIESKGADTDVLAFIMMHIL